MGDATTPLHGQRILLCVCGGIAVYKAADLVRRLRDAGAEVRVAMTESAQQFVSATTFQAVSHNDVRTTLWDAGAGGTAQGKARAVARTGEVPIAASASCAGCRARVPLRVSCRPVFR